METLGVVDVVCWKIWPVAINALEFAGSNSMIRPWVAVPEEITPSSKRVVKVAPEAVAIAAQPRLSAPTL